MWLASPKMTSKSDPTDCIWCSLNSSYDLFQYLFPVQCYCSHTRYNFSKKPCCKISKIGLTWFASLILFLIVCVTNYFIYAPIACAGEKSLCVIYMTDEFFVVGSCILLLLSVCNVETQESELNTWLFVFENRRSFGLGSIMQRDIAFKINKASSVFTVVVNCLMLYLTFSYSYDNFPGNILRKMAICFCYAFQTRGAFEVIKRISLMGGMLQALETSLKTMKMTKLYLCPDTCLTTKLRRYQNLICVINNGMEVYMKVTAVMLSVWTIMLVVTLIVNIYVWIENWDFSFGTLSVLQLRTFVTVLGIVVIAFRTENNVNKKVRCFDGVLKLT
jgi:hypothetical protein